VDEVCRGELCEPGVGHARGDKIWSACEYSHDCGFDWSLTCWGGRCVHLRREGMDCDVFAPWQRQCQEGLSCQLKEGYESLPEANSGRCERRSCMQSCADDPCEEDEICRTTGCVAPALEGETCGVTPCGADLFCDSESRICLPRMELGEPCNQDDQCPTGTCGREPDCEVKLYATNCSWSDVGVCIPKPSLDDCRSMR
jgi:hypothetical protein